MTRITTPLRKIWRRFITFLWLSSLWLWIVISGSIAFDKPHGFGTMVFYIILSGLLFSIAIRLTRQAERDTQ
jgi:hypothetical protein